MAPVGGHPLLHLGLYRGVPPQQGQIPVGGSGGDDFQDSRVHQSPAGPQQVLAEVLAEGPAQLPVVGLPPLGQGGEVVVPQPLEGIQIIPGRLDLVIQVFLKLFLEGGRSQHLRQDGGDPQGDPGSQALLLQAVEDLEQRDVGLGRRFVEPVHAVGPTAVADDVGQMGMEHKGEIS